MWMDLSDKTFGRLTVIKRNGSSESGDRLWLCKCECGNTVSVVGTSLNKGVSISCGCYRKEAISKRMKTHGQSRGTAEYNIWNLMITRCNDLNHKNYGGRGICVCERWLNFEHFFLDMGKRPSDKHSLDRIDNDGNYEPTNCRWATKKEQDRNRRTNKWLEYNGIKMILQDWANKWGITAGAISNHFKKGKTFEDIYIHFESKNK